MKDEKVKVDVKVEVKLLPVKRRRQSRNRK